MPVRQGKRQNRRPDHKEKEAVEGRKHEKPVKCKKNRNPTAMGEKSPGGWIIHVKRCCRTYGHVINAMNDPVISKEKERQL